MGSLCHVFNDGFVRLMFPAGIVLTAEGDDICIVIIFAPQTLGNGIIGKIQNIGCISAVTVYCCIKIAAFGSAIEEERRGTSCRGLFVIIIGIGDIDKVVKTVFHCHDIPHMKTLLENLVLIIAHITGNNTGFYLSAVKYRQAAKILECFGIAFAYYFCIRIIVKDINQLPCVIIPVGIVDIGCRIIIVIGSRANFRSIAKQFEIVGYIGIFVNDCLSRSRNDIINGCNFGRIDHHTTLVRFFQGCVLIVGGNF